MLRSLRPRGRYKRRSKTVRGMEEALRRPERGSADSQAVALPSGQSTFRFEGDVVCSRLSWVMFGFFYFVWPRKGTRRRASTRRSFLSCKNFARFRVCTFMWQSFRGETYFLSNGKHMSCYRRCFAHRAKVLSSTPCREHAKAFQPDP